MNAPVLRQMAALRSLPTERLKAMWEELNGGAAPPYNRAFLVKRLGYRLQELAFGGLSAEAERRLDELAEGLDSKPARTRAREGAAPVTGTKLIREWQGVMEEVTVLAEGFEWRGRRYKSLSAVARAITGTRWNGPLFFGLRKHGKQGGTP